MTILKTLIKYISCYLMFYLVTSLFVGGELKNTIMSLVTIALIALFVISVITLTLGSSNNAVLSRCGNFFNKTIFKLLLPVLGLSALCSGLLSMILGL